MAMFLDARVPVVFGALADAGSDDALLIQGEWPGVADRPAARYDVENRVHAVGCACCVPRSAAADALARLFIARARGTVPFFRRVVAVTRDAAGTEALREAVAADAVASGRFRIVEG